MGFTARIWGRGPKNKRPGPEKSRAIRKYKTIGEIRLKRAAYIFCLLILINEGILSQQSRFTKLTGPYLGQKAPGAIPEVFAPGIVSTEAYNHASITVNPDGTEIYWASDNASIGHRVIWYSKYANGRWSDAMITEFTMNDDGDCPMLSHDGSRLYFLSNRPLKSDNNKEDKRIWYVNQTKTGWTEPEAVDATINGEHLQWQVSVDKDLNLYFGSERKGSKGIGQTSQRR